MQVVRETSKGIIFLFFLLLLSLLFVPERVSAASTYNQAAIIGQVISYDAGDNSFVVFGRMSAKVGGKWQIVETRKFYRIYPSLSRVTKALDKHMNDGIKVYGAFQVASTSEEEQLLNANRTADYNPEKDASPAYGPGVGPFPYIGFGVAVRSQKYSTFEITGVNSFVTNLAVLRDTLLGTDGEKTKLTLDGGASEIIADKSVWRSLYGSKWYTVKNATARTEGQAAAGGTAFFVGLKGGSNGFVSSVPVLRPDIDNFMASAGGGDNEIEKGSALFFGSVTASKNGYGEIDGVYVSGPFFTETDNLISGLKSGKAPHSGTWKVKGWDENRIKVLDGKKCWLAGHRVLVYDEEGNLIDHYFSMDKSLTVDEFNTLLDLQREIAMKGGM